VPSAATAGATLNSAALVVLTRNWSICPASFGGPAEMPVAQFGTACAPASSATVWFAPFVKLGTSLIGLTVMATVVVPELRLPSLAR
jgi:hypothetical protein